MIHSPFTKTGEIRYLELFKITFVIGLFVMGISIGLEQSVHVANSSLGLTAFTMLLGIIQLMITNISTFVSIIRFLKACIINITLEVVQKVHYYIQHISTSTHKVLVSTTISFRTLCVIRC